MEKIVCARYISYADLSNITQSTRSAVINQPVVQFTGTIWHKEGAKSMIPTSPFTHRNVHTVRGWPRRKGKPFLGRKKNFGCLASKTTGIEKPCVFR
jgi:hypothetical protein